MARAATRVARDVREVSVLQGGPKDRWGYFTDELTAQAERGDANGVPFMYRITGRLDLEGRRVWQWQGPAEWPRPISTYDPERAYWHSTHGD